MYFYKPILAISGLAHFDRILTSSDHGLTSLKTIHIKIPSQSFRRAAGYNLDNLQKEKKDNNNNIYMIYHLIWQAPG